MKSKYQRGNAELGLVATIVIVIIVGFWLHARITEFSSVLSVDFDTAGSVLLRLAIFAGLLAALTWLTSFLKAICYLPLALWLALPPALNYWSTAPFGPKFGGSVAWYGSLPVQVLVAIVLLGLGLWGHKWISDNTY